MIQNDMRWSELVPDGQCGSVEGATPPSQMVLFKSTRLGTGAGSAIFC